MSEQGTPKPGDVFFLRQRYNGIVKRTVLRVTPAGRVEFAEYAGVLWKRFGSSGRWYRVGGNGFHHEYAIPATPELEAEYRAHAVRLRIESLANDIAKAVRTSTIIPPKGTVPTLESIIAALVPAGGPDAGK